MFHNEYSLSYYSVQELSQLLKILIYLFFKYLLSVLCVLGLVPSVREIQWKSHFCYKGTQDLACEREDAKVIK